MFKSKKGNQLSFWKITLSTLKFNFNISGSINYIELFQASDKRSSQSNKQSFIYVIILPNHKILTRSFTETNI